jgi:hypothetical protein
VTVLASRSTTASGNRSSTQARKLRDQRSAKNPITSEASIPSTIPVRIGLGRMRQ